MKEVTGDDVTDVFHPTCDLDVRLGEDHLEQVFQVGPGQAEFLEAGAGAGAGASTSRMNEPTATVTITITNDALSPKWQF